jgi:hypothetical protein
MAETKDGKLPMECYSRKLVQLKFNKFELLRKMLQISEDAHEKALKTVQENKKVSTSSEQQASNMRINTNPIALPLFVQFTISKLEKRSEGLFQNKFYGRNFFSVTPATLTTRACFPLRC